MAHQERAGCAIVINKKITYGAPLDGAPLLWMYLWRTPGRCAIAILPPSIPSPLAPRARSPSISIAIPPREIPLAADDPPNPPLLNRHRQPPAPSPAPPPPPTPRTLPSNVLPIHKWMQLKIKKQIWLYQITNLMIFFHIHKYFEIKISMIFFHIHKCFQIWSSFSKKLLDATKNNNKKLLMAHPSVVRHY